MVLPAAVFIASLLTLLNFLLGSWIGKRLDIKFPPFLLLRTATVQTIFWAFALGWLFVLFGGATFWGKIGLNSDGYPGAFFVQGHPWYTIFCKYIRSRFWLTIIVVFVALQPLLSPY